MFKKLNTSGAFDISVVILLVLVVAIGGTLMWRINNTEIEGPVTNTTATSEETSDNNDEQNTENEYLEIEEWSVKIPKSALKSDTTYTLYEPETNNIIIHSSELESEIQKLSEAEQDIAKKCAYTWAYTSIGRAETDSDNSKFLSNIRTIDNFQYGVYSPQYACDDNQPNVTNLLKSYVYSYGTSREDIINAMESY